MLHVTRNTSSQLHLLQQAIRTRATDLQRHFKDRRNSFNNTSRRMVAEVSAAGTVLNRPPGPQ
eukprot:1007658-Amphidinium_carterae.1